MTVLFEVYCQYCMKLVGLKTATVQIAGDSQFYHYILASLCTAYLHTLKNNNQFQQNLHKWVSGIGIYQPCFKPFWGLNPKASWRVFVRLGVVGTNMKPRLSRGLWEAWASLAHGCKSCPPDQIPDCPLKQIDCGTSSTLTQIYSVRVWQRYPGECSTLSGLSESTLRVLTQTERWYCSYWRNLIGP
jgi:hypothetical protein